jgi:hypothetical protein
MINTKAGKEAREADYRDRGYWDMPQFASHLEPYITWEQMIHAIILCSNENSLQLSATDCISNTEKGKNE